MRFRWVETEAAGTAGLVRKRIAYREEEALWLGKFYYYDGSYVFGFRQGEDEWFAFREVDKFRERIFRTPFGFETFTTPGWAKRE